MTPEQAREAAAVMAAFADGKKIECKSNGDGIRWVPKEHKDWRWDQFTYRVAPELWTGKIWVHPDGRTCAPAHWLDAQMTKAQGFRLITVREVGDE